MELPNHLDAVWLERIANSIAGLKYGQVQITIHDGRIVQIERCERLRFDPPPVATKQRVNRRQGKPLDEYKERS